MKKSNAKSGLEDSTQANVDLDKFVITHHKPTPSCSATAHNKAFRQEHAGHAGARPPFREVEQPAAIGQRRDLTGEMGRPCSAETAAGHEKRSMFAHLWEAMNGITSGTLTCLGEHKQGQEQLNRFSSHHKELPMAMFEVTVEATVKKKLKTYIEIPDNVEIDPTLRDDIVEQIKMLTSGSDYRTQLGTWKIVADNLTRLKQPLQSEDELEFKLVDGVVRFTNPSEEE